MTNKNRIKLETIRITTLVILVFSLFLLLSGITFAVYKRFIKGTTNNIIEAGVMAFSYDEDTFQGNGVKIDNAFPMTDVKGMSLKGTNEYFDFSVSAHTTIEDIYYEVLVLKQDISTLNDSWVKVYVTTRNGSVEVASPLVMNDTRVKTFQELENSSDNSGKIVYSAVVPKEINYYQDFRLRLWIDENVKYSNDYLNKTFSVKVKVNAKEM